MKYVYTSITKGYLPKARVCASTLKKIHPDWHFVVVFSDSLPDNLDIDAEPFDSVINVTDLGIPDFKSWLFKHNVVELCTAVKGSVLKKLLLKQDCELVMYIDPDIAIYNTLEPLVELLESKDILLTPHMLHPEYELDRIEGNEIVSTMAHGIFNLGFIAVANSEQGRDFSEWWERRLLNFCYDDVAKGLFTDQKWCDFVPVFFENSHIIRDIGYNVATWNISYRPITKDEKAGYLAGGVPLRFYHFTGYDAGYNYELLRKFSANNPAAFELWEEYGKMLEECGNNDASLKHWAYAFYDDGELIDKNDRILYRNDSELQKKFPDPYDSSDTGFRELRKIYAGNAGNTSDEARELRAELASVYHSHSWRITSPLRFLMRMLKRVYN